MKTIHTKLRKLCKLSLHEWQLLFEAGLELPLSRFLLFTRGVKWATETYSRAPVPGESAVEGETAMDARGARSDPQEEEERLSRSIVISIGRLTSNTPMRFACLTRSVAACRMLAKRGVRGTLKIGVKKNSGNLIGAHAWIEVAGIPIGESQGLADYRGFDWEKQKSGDG